MVTENALDLLQSLAATARGENIESGSTSDLIVENGAEMLKNFCFSHTFDPLFYIAHIAARL
jgi:hypothetical protein